MSGSKVVAVSGISQAATVVGSGISTTAIALGAATALGLTALVVAAGVTVALTRKAIEAYEERQRQQREAAEKREREIQQRIADIRAQIRSRGSQAKVRVTLPPESPGPVSSESAKTGEQKDNQPESPGPVSGESAKTGEQKDNQPESPGPVSGESAKTGEQKDNQRQIREWKSRLTNIEAEYQALIAQELLDHSTVNQALEKTKQALNSNNLDQAKGYLQALDDARIQVLNGLREQWVAQIEYVEQRLAGLRSRIPQPIAQELQIDIDWAKNNWQQLTQDDLDTLHQRISAFESQADSVQKAAEKMVETQHQVGYTAYLRGLDNGDAVVEVETHEGVNTQIRFDFYGQQIVLEGPPEESSSCAVRTVEAMRLFQEQGYQLEWTEWDGKTVPDDLRYLYSVSSAPEGSETQEGTEEDQRSRRRRESEGH